ncbi:MAG: condensation domain-containing protein [Verrucomicrobiales bacterium]
MPSRDNVADIYRLSELQEALLLHRLQNLKEDDGHLQMGGVLGGRIDDGIFKKAWQATFERHPVLRSIVRWKKIKHPVQMVLKRADPEIKFLDWRDIQVPDQESRLEELRTSDRRKGIDITKAPAMRFYLARTGRRSYRFIWSCHHIFLDGWSCAVVLRDVVAAYEAMRMEKPQGEPNASTFREYVAWSRSEQEGAAPSFWKPADVAGELLLSPQTDSPAADGIAATQTLENITPSQVASWAKARGVTPNIFFLAAWSLLLSEALDASSVVFGLTVSGRSVPIQGIENMAGMFSNTLPFSTDPSPDKDLGSWVQEIYARQQAVRVYESFPLSRILQSTDQALDRAPFDTLFVFANFPVETSRRSAFSRAVVLESFEGDLTSTYPLTLTLVPGDSYRIKLHSRSPQVDGGRAAEILRNLEEIADRLLGSEIGQTIGELRQQRESPLLWQEFKRERAEEDCAATVIRPSSYRPPATPLEAELAGVWRELLKCEWVGRDDRFFDLGGKSLALPSLIDRINRQLGVELPLGIVFQAATVKELARVIEELDPELAERIGYSRLVEIQRGKSTPALFATAGGVGVEEELLLFGALAPHLDPELPIFGLRSGALDESPAESLDEIVSENLEELRKRQPEGPYLIAGECISGVIAFEMARRLVEDGHEVARLILLDAKHPDQADIAYQEGEGFERLVRIQGAERAGLIQGYYLLALRAELGSYPGKVDLIVAEKSEELHGEMLGWEPHLTGPCRIHRVPGDHDTYIREFNRELGESLNAVCKDALATSPAAR